MSDSNIFENEIKSMFENELIMFRKRKIYTYDIYDFFSWINESDCTFLVTYFQISEF